MKQDEVVTNGKHGVFLRSVRGHVLLLAANNGGKADVQRPTRSSLKVKEVGDC